MRKHANTRKITLNKVLKQTNKQKKAEYQKLRKRANTRLSRLEEAGIINDAYKKAVSDAGDSRFPGVTRKVIGYTQEISTQELDHYLKAVIDFLNNKTSMVGMAKISPEYRYNIKYRDIDQRRLSYEEKVKLNRKLGQIANKRLTRLEKNDKTKNAYAKVKQYLDSIGADKFYTGKKWEDNSKALTRQINALSEFLSSKTSTMWGYTNLTHQRLQQLDDFFGGKMPNHIRQDPDSFFDFLSSDTYKDMKLLLDSEQVFEDYNRAVGDGYSAKSLMKEYEYFLRSNMTFEQVDEMRKAGKFLK